MNNAVCLVTGTRAEFGLLLPLIQRLRDDPDIDLRLVVTGSHLKAAYGGTLAEIEEYGLQTDAKIDIIQSGSDTPLDISNAIGAATVKFGEYFNAHPPRLVVVLGDRYETLGVCCGALPHGVPIAHIHGGETTEGAIDESIRHAITKMSYLHFTSCKAYRDRVIQMGENPERVFSVGALGVENILNIPLISKERLADEISPVTVKPYLLATFHPVTLEKNTEAEQMEELLAAIEQSGYNVLFTKSNADSGGKIINQMIDGYSAAHTDTCSAFHSLGLTRYLSAMKHCAMVVGNSSSGIIEAPSFQVPTINIGDRQRGRIQAESVINCAPKRREILAAFRLGDSPKFREKLRQVKSPYGSGGTSESIMRVIKEFLIPGRIDLKKRFWDLDSEAPSVF